MAATESPVSLPDRYRATRRIASGGMATVYATEDTVLGRLVAVKVLSPAFAGDDDAQTRFQREARAAAKVSDHPHVVTIYDIGEWDGQSFIVMEYYPGGTVADRLREDTPIPPPTAVQWLSEAASALDHAHAAGIVHRDVKPANLLLDGNGRLAVGDFGIARMASDAGVTLTGQVLGTAAYLSPEQALGKAATPASDRYALAVVAFQMLTGRRVFEAGNVAAQARAHVEGEPPRASSLAPALPRAVDAVLWRGLEKDPADRWPSAGAMTDALAGALGDQAEPATAPTAPVAARRGRQAAATGAAGAAAAAGAAEAAPVVAREPRPRAAAAAPPAAPLAQRAGRPARVGRGAVLALVALLLLGAVVALVAGGGGSGRSGATTTAHHRSTPAKARKHAAPAAPAASTPATSSSTPTTTAAPAPAPAPTGASKSALQARGHALIAAGQYDQAIAVLRQATQDCPVSTTDPCAYALFDLGHALRLAGQPAAAIPVLEQRLQNPDGRSVVLAELALARQQAGQVQPVPSASTPGAGHGNGNGKAKKDH